VGFFCFITEKGIFDGINKIIRILVLWGVAPHPILELFFYPVNPVKKDSALLCVLCGKSILICFFKTKD